MKVIVFVLFLVAMALAAQPTQETLPPSGSASAESSPAEMVPVDVMREELALRDSVMQVRDSLCVVEKDSLRKAMVVEEAKCANWEQSYQTMKQNNEVCAKALGIALEVNEKTKNKADDEKKKAAAMSSTSFFGGLGIGLLVMWLIMK